MSRLLPQSDECQCAQCNSDEPVIRKGTFSQEAERASALFFQHKRLHPEPVPYEKLTPLQKRMQSGGA